MNIQKSVITLTFGDQAENHVGMEQLGKLANVGEGFHLDDFEKIIETFSKLNCKVDLYDLVKLSKEEKEKENAYVLVIRDGVNAIFKDLGLDEKWNHEMMFIEQSSLDVDKKVYMYGRVVNKHARWNLCFDVVSQEPDYENKKGRIVAFSDIPITNCLVQNFPNYFGEKSKDLKGEGNYYFDKLKCGIGFHGDSERRKVLAVRLGASLDIHFQWFKNGEKIGERVVVPLNGGDIYLMCEKAVGTDWKKKKIATLRHATGCSKFTSIKEKEKKKKIIFIE